MQRVPEAKTEWRPRCRDTKYERPSALFTLWDFTERYRPVYGSEYAKWIWKGLGSLFGRRPVYKSGPIRHNHL